MKINYSYQFNIFFSYVVNYQCLIILYIFSVVVTVKFDKARYQVNETDKYVELFLVFNIPSSSDINITVFSKDKSATGKH